MPQLKDNVHSFTPRRQGNHTEKLSNSGIIETSHSDGGGGGMESRVAKLEADVEHMKADIAGLKADVRTILTDTSVIKSDLNVMKSNYVTREYLEQRFREQNRNLIAIIIAAAGIVGPFLTWLLQHYKP